MNTTPKSPLTDDELGAMLGDSVRGRVDAVPTITPSFDGVERRARQITNRRRAAAGLAVGALALFGGLGATALFSDDEGATENDVVTEPDTTPTEDSAPIEDPAPIESGTLPFDLTAIVDGTRLIGVEQADGTEIELLDLSSDGEQFLDAVMLADGSVLAEITTGVGDSVVRHYPTPDGGPIELSPNGHLAGGAVIGDQAFAFVSDLPSSQAATGDLRIVDLATMESTVLLADANGPTARVMEVDYKGGQIVVIEQHDVDGATWFFRSLDGQPATPGPAFPDSGFDAGAGRFSPRFDRNGDGLLWLELESQTDEWWLVTAEFDATETERQSLEVGPGGTVLAFELQVSSSMLVANMVDGNASGPDITTVWMSPTRSTDGSVSGYDMSPEVEPGLARFVQPPAVSAPVDEPTADDPAVDDFGDDPAPTEWLEPELLGIIQLEGGWPTDGEWLVGQDEDDTVWLAGPTDGTPRTGGGRAWQVDGVRAVRAVVDTDSQHTLFDLGGRIIHVDPGNQARVIADAAELVGTALVNGRPVAFIAELSIARGGAVEVGDLVSIDLTTGASTVILADASRADASVEEVHVVGERLLVEGGGEMPWVVMLDADGIATDDTLPALAPGTHESLTLSADGATVYVLERAGATTSFEPQLTLLASPINGGPSTAPMVLTLPPTEVRLDYDLVAISGGLLISPSWPGGRDESGQQTTSYAAPLLLDPATGELVELGLVAAAWKPVAN